MLTESISRRAVVRFLVITLIIGVLAIPLRDERPADAVVMPATTTTFRFVIIRPPISINPCAFVVCTTTTAAPIDPRTCYRPGEPPYNIYTEATLPPCAVQTTTTARPAQPPAPQPPAPQPPAPQPPAPQPPAPAPVAPQPQPPKDPGVVIVVPEIPVPPNPIPKPPEPPKVVEGDSVRIEVRPVGFGDVPVGTTAIREFEIINSGSIPVRITAARVPTPFAVTPGGGTCPSTPLLNAGGQCTFVLTYRPVDTSALSSRVEVEILAPAGPAVASAGVTGRGTGPRLEFSPPIADLGAGANGTPVRVETTLRNSGSLPITVASVVQPRAKRKGLLTINAKACVKKILAPGQSCKVIVTFATLNGPVEYFIDALGTKKEPARLTLKRRGLVAAFTITPPLADFGPVKVGVKTKAKRFTVRNTGAVPLTFSVPLIAGVAKGDFAVSATTCGAPLALKKTCAIDVVMTGSGAGLRAASLSIGISPKAQKVVQLRGVTPLPVTTATTVVKTLKPVITRAPTTTRLILNVPPIPTNPPTTVPATRPNLVVPVLRMNPSVGATGRVTFAEGSGFPPNSDVVLRWERYGGEWKATTDDGGTFRVPVLVRSGEPIGGRSLIAEGTDRFETVRAPYLVQLPTFRPPGYSGRTDRLVARG